MVINKETLKQYCPIIAAFAIGGVLGWGAKTLLHHCPTQATEATAPTEKVRYVDKVKTEIAYVPKETIVYKDGTTATEKTDVDVTIPKQTLAVKVNGKTMEVSKTSDEKYLFEKNKLTMKQETAATLDIKIPTIDNTRRWEIGVGASKNGVAGMVGYPIKSNVGGWIAGDKQTVMAGVKIHF